jgi:hypothetical protein
MTYEHNDAGWKKRLKKEKIKTKEREETFNPIPCMNWIPACTVSLILILASMPLPPQESVCARAWMGGCMGLCFVVVIILLLLREHQDSINWKLQCEHIPTPDTICVQRLNNKTYNVPTHPCCFLFAGRPAGRQPSLCCVIQRGQ